MVDFPRTKYKTHTHRQSPNPMHPPPPPAHHTANLYFPFTPLATFPPAGSFPVNPPAELGVFSFSVGFAFSASGALAAGIVDGGFVAVEAGLGFVCETGEGKRVVRDDYLR